VPERMLISPPEGTDLAPLPAWLKKSSKRARQGWVVWLDDLDRHLAAANLTPALVAELGQAGAVVAATIRSQRLQDLRPSATDHGPAVEGVGYAVLKPPPLTLAREWSPPERERARTSGDERLVRAADDERFGVAEQLAAGPYLQQIWESGPDSGHPRGYALVAAAVGLAQAGLASPLTREQLHTAHTAYLPAPPPLPEEADRAWAWATQPRSGLAGLLVPADHQGHRWRAFDYFTTQDRLPDAVWHTALDAATDQDRFNVGVTAYRAEQIDIAERAWHPLAKQGDTEAMVGLGVLLKDTGRGEEAKAWFRKAAKQGDADAMVQFGALLQDTGRGEEAKAWFRKAAKQGHIRAMVILGLLLFYEARVEEVKAWLRKNPDADHTDVLAGHEALLADTGQADTGQLLEEAERWFRQAAENGNTSAMFNLGDLLEATGRGEEAEDWRQQAREIEGPE
ncbi:MAG: sel1 repeat family protein, partial [Nocardiopsis sp. BM-2018]